MDASDQSKPQQRDRGGLSWGLIALQAKCEILSELNFKAKVIQKNRL